MPEIIIIPIIFICLTYMIVAIARSIQKSRRDSRMAEVTSKLLERMGSGPELAAFVTSDAYRTLIDSEPPAESGILTRILNSLQAGAVLFAAGAAMLSATNWLRDSDAREVFGVMGSVLLAVGIALTLSALWSNWLAKRWNTPAGRP